MILCAAALLSLTSGALADEESGSVDELDSQYVYTDPWADGYFIVTLDPGHGGKTTGGGASWYGGRYYEEGKLVMKIADYLKEELEQYWHVKVYMTREDNSTAPELIERVQKGVETDSDLVLSLHLNGLNGKKQGACVLVTGGKYDPTPNKNLKSTEEGVGRAILKELHDQIGIKNNGFLYRDSTETRYPNNKWADYYGIIRGGVLNGIPSILVEHCYLDNKKDFELTLNSEAKLKALAKADADALVKYYGLRKDEYGSHRLKDYIDYAREKAWLQGYSNGDFRPDSEVTRATMVSLLRRFGDVPAGDGKAEFSDVPESKWYHDDVSWAASLGIEIYTSPL